MSTKWRNSRDHHLMEKERGHWWHKAADQPAKRDLQEMLKQAVENTAKQEIPNE